MAKIDAARAHCGETSRWYGPPFCCLCSWQFVIKLYGLGPKEYFTDLLNILDFIIIVISIVEWTFSSGGRHLLRGLCNSGCSLWSVSDVCPLGMPRPRLVRCMYVQIYACVLHQHCVGDALTPPPLPTPWVTLPIFSALAPRPPAPAPVSGLDLILCTRCGWVGGWGAFFVKAGVCCVKSPLHPSPSARKGLLWVFRRAGACLHGLLFHRSANNVPLLCGCVAVLLRPDTERLPTVSSSHDARMEAPAALVPCVHLQYRGGQ